MGATLRSLSTLLRGLLTVRVVAVLMLLAGASLGVLLARTLWAQKPTPASGGVLDQAIEHRVQLYVRLEHLGPRGEARVRRCLTEYDRAVTDLYRTLRQEQAHRFQALSGSAQAELETILQEEREKAGR